MEIKGYNEEFIAEVPLHPDHPERGVRKLKFTPGKPVYVSKDDLELLKSNEYVRLKDLFNVKILEVSEEGIVVEFDSIEYEKARENKWRMIHWVPEGKPCEVLIPEGDELVVRKGLLETDADLKVDDIVQFERFGFVRIDKIEGEKVTAIFAHK